MAQTSLDQKRLIQLARFLVVGLAGTAAYLVLAFLLRSTGIAVFWSHAVASAISLAVSYFGQKIFTLGIAGDHARRGARFLAATALLVVVQSLLVIGLDAARAPDHIIFLASTAFYPPASYLIHTFWTFRRTVAESLSAQRD